MSSTGRFAVFALIESKDAQLIRFEQRSLTQLTGNSIALGFPVHITLKGRFLASSNVIRKIFEETCFKHLCLQPTLDTTIYLSNPKHLKSQLSWLEVLPENKGFYTLHLLHQIFEHQVNQLVLKDEVPDNHKYLNFRPHVTLGWGVTCENWQTYSTSEKFSLSKAEISHIGLVQYHKDWPAEEPVNLILKIPFCRSHRF